MNELIKKWIEALRSGEYKQSTGKLHSFDGGYCCLGVLCDVVDNTKWVGFTYNDRTACLPMSISILAGISNELESRLMRMNDTDQKTFNEIANFLEATIGEELINA